MRETLFSDSPKLACPSSVWTTQERPWSTTEKPLLLQAVCLGMGEHGQRFSAFLQTDPPSGARLGDSDADASRDDPGPYPHAISDLALARAARSLVLLRTANRTPQQHLHTWVLFKGCRLSDGTLIQDIRFLSADLGLVPLFPSQGGAFVLLPGGTRDQV